VGSTTGVVVALVGLVGEQVATDDRLLSVLLIRGARRRGRARFTVRRGRGDRRLVVEVEASQSARAAFATPNKSKSSQKISMKT
jgi:hypothetical protein